MTGEIRDDMPPRSSSSVCECGVLKLLPFEHNIFPSHRQLAVLFTLADGVLLNRVCLGNIFGHNLAVFTTHNFFNAISVIERPTNSSLLLLNILQTNIVTRLRVP